MKKFLRFANGARHVVGGLADIYPADAVPVEEIDLSEATREEFRQLRKNPHDNTLLDKVKKRKASRTSP